MSRKTHVDRTQTVTDPRGALKFASDSLSRDLRVAASGAFPVSESIRSGGDNVRDAMLLDVNGRAVVARPGTDVIELRGVLRTPLFSLTPSRNEALRGPPAESGELVSSPTASAHPGILQQHPSSVALQLQAEPGDRGCSGAGEGTGAEHFDRVLPALRDRTAAGGHAYFVVIDAQGAFAVSRVLSFKESQTEPDGAFEPLRAAGSSGAGSVPAATRPCEATVHLDFTDPGAVELNRGGDPRAHERLGPLIAGGLFDQIRYFVARGEEGQPPDYQAGLDPISLRYPHPYLVSALATGHGRSEMTRVAEEIEELQILFLTDRERGAGASLAPGVSAAAWDQSTAADRSPEELVDPFGRSRLQGIRVALVAKNAKRLRPGEAFAGARGKAVSLEGRDGYWLLNAPRPEDDPARAGPVGWAAETTRRVPFLRRFAMFELPVPEWD
ncbi:MAG: hypothetical protein ABIT01_01690 [Thermoanaerobaculia bacterium]